MVDNNYEIAAASYSYSILRKQFNSIMHNIFGGDCPWICFEPTRLPYEACLTKKRYPAQIAV